MSLITVTLNTESKDITVNVDGQEIVGAFHEVSIRKYENYDDEMKVDFYACKHDEKIGDVKQITNLTVYADCADSKLGKDNDVFLVSHKAYAWSKFLK